MMVMRRFFYFLAFLGGFGLNIYSQSISIDIPIITPTQDNYKVVEASDMIHAIEGSSAVYKINVTGIDSVVSVTSLMYNTTDITSNCHLDKGVLTIDDIIINNLVANDTLDFELSLTFKLDEEKEDTTIFADGMSIIVYPAPIVKEVEKPEYLSFYGQSEDNLTWVFNGTGGNQWICKWSIDDRVYEGDTFILEKIVEAKTSKLRLTASNIAPDDSTIWDKYEEEWQILVLPKVIVHASVEDGFVKRLLQDQKWTLSVDTIGGNATDWEINWFVDGKNTEVHDKSFTVSLNTQDEISDPIERKIELIVKYNLPDSIISSQESLVWRFGYTARFLPLLNTHAIFVKKYSHDICDGDSLLLKVDIIDKNGNSILFAPDCLWNFSWNSVDGKEDYQLIGNNNNNNNGIPLSIKCIVTGKFRDVEMKEIKDTLIHNVTVWPKPKVLPIKETESELISCGGKVIPVSVSTFGGQKDGWVYYYGKSDEELISTKENSQEFLIERKPERNAQPITQKYKIRAVNYTDGVVRCDTTQIMTVSVYPEPWMPNEVILIDKNRHNESVGNGIREGNEIALSCEECYGGYSNIWNYSWSRDNKEFSNTNETTMIIEDAYSGDKKNDSKKFSIKCEVNNHFGDELWASQEYSKQLTIYHKPKTPTSLVKKGNGSSKTMIATISVSDADLEGHEYYLVFGYIDNNGQMHDAKSLLQKNPGEIRWSNQLSSLELSDSNNHPYVYALWKYNNGVEITSGLCFMNSIDEYWDGSSYSGVTRSVIDNPTAIDNVYDCDNVVMPRIYYSTNGMTSQRPLKGFNIVRMNDGTVKKVFNK